MLERAQAALAEIDARRAAELVESARATHIEPDGNSRRHELARWAEQDDADEHEDGRNSEDEDVREK